MRYSTLTRLNPAAELNEAVEQFGPAGIGLPLTGLDLLTARLVSPAGHIAIEVAREQPVMTEVVVETMHFDDEVIDFIQEPPKESLFSAVLRRFRR